MKKTIMLPRQERGAEVRAASFNSDDNTIEVVFTTGATVRRRSWVDGTYDEELIVAPDAVRLDRLNLGAPFLNTHSDWSLSDVIGSVVPGTAKIVNGVGIARVKLSSAPSDADNIQKIKDGIVRNVSVGYVIHRVEKIETDGAAVPLWRVVDWEPYEISAVPVPADAGATIRSAGKPADGPRTFQCEFVMSDRNIVRSARMRMKQALALR